MMTQVKKYNFHSLTFSPECPDSGKLPLLLLHGFMGCAEDFEAVVQGLTPALESDRPPLSALHALDLPGHGRTQLRNPDHLTDYGMAETAQGVWQWTQMIQPGPWAIAGYSMGGRLALYLAAHYPNSFPVTFAIAASAGLECEGDRQKRQQLDERRASILEHCTQTNSCSNSCANSFEKFLTDWYQMPLFSHLANHPSFGEMLNRRRQNNPQLLAHSLRYLGLGQQPFLLPVLEKYSGNLHLVVGEYDNKFLGINRAIVRYHLCAQLTIIPNSGHTIPLENAVALAHILLHNLDCIPQKKLTLYKQKYTEIL